MRKGYERSALARVLFKGYIKLLKVVYHYGASILTLALVCGLAAVKYKELSGERIPAGKGVIIKHHAAPKFFGNFKN